MMNSSKIFRRQKRTKPDKKPLQKERKRFQVPLGQKISGKTFGLGRRMRIGRHVPRNIPPIEEPVGVEPTSRKPSSNPSTGLVTV